MYLDRPTPRVRRLAERLTQHAETDRDRATALFDFVHHHIEFGFTRHFDLATPEQTLAAGRGHCNPQGALFVALLRSVGIGAWQRFYTIDSRVLDGLFASGMPARLSHATTELVLDGQTVELDGYIVDAELRVPAVARCRAEGRELGYGVHVDAAVGWDGSSEPAMSQLADPRMAIARHDRYVDPTRFFRSADYRHPRLGVVGQLAFGAFVAKPANRVIDRIRRSVGSSSSTRIETVASC